jgi:hypothetical protein
LPFGLFFKRKIIKKYQNIEWGHLKIFSRTTVPEELILIKAF